MNLYRLLRDVHVKGEIEIVTDEGADNHFPDWCAGTFKAEDRLKPGHIREIDDYSPLELLLMPVTAVMADSTDEDGPLLTIHVNPWRREGPSPNDREVR